MEQALKYKHGDILISYNISKNVWEFTLRGRDRSAESLEKAMEAIDKPEPKEKAFDPMPCFLDNYSGWMAGKVTSVAEKKHWYNGRSVWVSTSEGRRTHNAKSVYLDTEQNKKQIERCVEIAAQIAKLNKELEELKSKMETVHSYLDKLEGGKA